MHWNVSPVAYPTGPFGQLFFVVCVSVVVFLCFFLLLSLWSGDLLFLCGFVPVFCTLLIPFPPSVHSSLSSFLFLLLSFCISSSHPSLPPSYLPGSLTLSLLPLSPPLWVHLCPTPSPPPSLLPCHLSASLPACLSVFLCLCEHICFYIPFFLCVDRLLFLLQD